MPPVLLKIATKTYLNIWALELWLQDAFTRKAGHMETVAVRVPDQNVTSIRNVDAIRETGYLLVPDAVLECAVLLKYCHTVAFEVAHIKIGT